MVKVIYVSDGIRILCTYSNGESSFCIINLYSYHIAFYSIHEAWEQGEVIGSKGTLQTKYDRKAN